MYTKTLRVSKLLTSLCIASDSNLITRSCYCPECRDWRKELKGKALDSQIEMVIYAKDPLDFCRCDNCQTFKTQKTAYTGRPSKHQKGAN